MNTYKHLIAIQDILIHGVYITDYCWFLSHNNIIIRNIQFHNYAMYVMLCSLITDNLQEIIDLKISLGFIATFLVLLGPCGCCCLCYLYKIYVHKYCIKCIHKVPQTCFKDYKPINENVDNNNGNEQVNQPA